MIRSRSARPARRHRPATAATTEQRSAHPAQGMRPLAGRQFGGWYLPDFADLSCGASKAADVITPPVIVTAPKGSPALVACRQRRGDARASRLRLLLQPDHEDPVLVGLGQQERGQQGRVRLDCQRHAGNPGGLWRSELGPQCGLSGDDVARLHGSERHGRHRSHRSGPRGTFYAISPTTLARRVLGPRLRHNEKRREDACGHAVWWLLSLWS